MRALLDTHAFIWAADEPGRFGRLDELIDDPEHELVVSAVVAWELAIKAGGGKLVVDDALSVFYRYACQAIDATHLPITAEHALVVERLPRHHTDPFDRLLVAQAQTLGVPIITADRRIARYDVEVLSPN